MPATADYETLMRQAPDAMDVYLSAAVRSIDKQFGEGYARENAVLVAAYIQGCAKDFGCLATIGAIHEASNALSYALQSTGLAGAMQDAEMDLVAAIGDR